MIINLRAHAVVTECLDEAAHCCVILLCGDIVVNADGEGLHHVVAFFDLKGKLLIKIGGCDAVGLEDSVFNIFR